MEVVTDNKKHEEEDQLREQVGEVCFETNADGRNHNCLRGATAIQILFLGRASPPILEIVKVTDSFKFLFKSTPICSISSSVLLILAPSQLQSSTIKISRLFSPSLWIILLTWNNSGNV